MPPKPPILRSVKTALRDVRSAAETMPGVFAVAFAVALASAIVASGYAPSGKPPKLDAHFVAFGVVNAIVMGAIFAPFAVLIHRWIILGEAGSLSSIPALRSRILEFFVVSVLLQAFFFVLITAVAVMAMAQPGLVVILFAIILMTAMLYLGMRMILLFPAIAIGAADRTIGVAFDRSRGLVWRSFAAGFLFTIAVMLVEGVATYLIGLGAPSARPAAAFAASALSNLIVTAGAIAIASRFYMWRRDADAAGRPGDEVTGSLVEPG